MMFVDVTLTRPHSAAGGMIPVEVSKRRGRPSAPLAGGNPETY